MVNVTCGGQNPFYMYPAGDFSSDAQFFVFTGVISFLGTMGSLVVYVFFAEMYLSEQKRAPMFVSFCFTDFLVRKSVKYVPHAWKCSLECFPEGFL